MAQRRDQLAGGFVALRPVTEALVDHLLQVIAAGKGADVLAPHRFVDVAPEQHRDELAHLVDVVLLLPFANFPPRNLGRRVHQVERIGWAKYASRSQPAIE